MLPWTQKYRPKNIKGIRGQDKAAEALRSFVDNFKNNKQRSALVYGPPGCGKTSAAYAVAKELDLEVIEVNASDVRNKESINEVIGPASSQMSLFSRGKIILVDEIDGLSGTKDRGGIQAITKLIAKSGFPLILTAQDPYDKKFKALRKISLMLEFHGLSYTSIKSVLKDICYKERINYDDVALTALARRAGGDLRGAINDLQTLSEFTKRLKMEDVDELGGRRQMESMASALVKVLKTTNPDIARTAFDDVDEDFDQIFLWVESNMPKEYEKIGDIARAYDAISLADVYRGRIRRWQYWRYLVYIKDFLTAGVAMAKEEKYKKFVKYMPTMRLLRIWQSNMKNAKKKAIAEKIADKTHTSSKRVMDDVLPYLKKVWTTKSPMKGKLEKELELTKDEVMWLKK